MSIRREAFLSILVAGALAAGLVSAPAFAGKKISPPAGCVIFPPAYVDTGNPFQVKIVKDPSYPGGWVAPLVEAAATFKVRGPGTVTVSYTGSVSRAATGRRALSIPPSTRSLPQRSTNR
jgi:hypothetical protein